MAKMTVAEAAEAWVAAKKALKVHEPKLKAAALVLKEHFRAKETTTYKGLVGYQHSTYTALDLDLARAELGKKAAACEVTRERETLSLLG